MINSDLTAHCKCKLLESNDFNNSSRAAKWEINASYGSWVLVGGKKWFATWEYLDTIKKYEIVPAKHLALSYWC